MLTARLADEAVLLDLATKHYYRLNATGAAIWNGVERGLARDAIVAELCAAFEVGPDEAADETDRFLAEIARRGLVAPPPD